MRYTLLICFASELTDFYLNSLPAWLYYATNGAKKTALSSTSPLINKKCDTRTFLFFSFSTNRTERSKKILNNCHLFSYKRITVWKFLGKSEYSAWRIPVSCALSRSVLYSSRNLLTARLVNLSFILKIKNINIWTQQRKKTIKQLAKFTIQRLC